MYTLRIESINAKTGKVFNTAERECKRQTLFAACLRASLVSRSYGAHIRVTLLHKSISTEHVYCNGIEVEKDDGT